MMFELIEKYDTITIYRHISPDSDALGSQLGLKEWIQTTYPNKNVYALGNDEGSKHRNADCMDIVSDDIIKESLAIILDTANAARVDDQRYQLAKYKLKIDHHVFVEQFADTEILEDRAGATCEILASIFMEKGCQLTPTCAQYLYGGLIADTLRFSISATTPSTLRVAAYLLEAGVDLVKVNEENFSTSLRLFRFENYLRNNFQLLDDKIAYILIKKEDYEAFHLTFQEAKEKVFVLSGVEEFEAWALFVEKEKDENGKSIFNGSLRSKYKTINDIANQFQGGGHRLACGVKGLRKEDIEKLLHQILERVK